MAEPSNRVPMDVTVGWGKESLARFMRALVKFRCTVTDSFTLASLNEMQPHCSVFLRVHVPPDSIDAFGSEAKPQHLAPAPCVGILDMTGPPQPRYCVKCGAPEDDHPYRHPFVAIGARP